MEHHITLKIFIANCPITPIRDEIENWQLKQVSTKNIEIFDIFVNWIHFWHIFSAYSSDLHKKP